MPPINTFQKACLAIAVSQSIAVPIEAATITVDSVADTAGQNSNSCTLRDAITSANNDMAVSSSSCNIGNGDDTIVFDGSLANQTITLSSPLPTVDSTISINGLGQNRTTISGNNSVKILSVYYGDLTVRNLTLMNGSASGFSSAFSSGVGVFARGAAIEASRSTLTLNSLVISGNSAVNGGGVFAQRSSVTIQNSTFSENTVVNGGGGADFVFSSVTISNSTFSENTSIRTERGFDSTGGGGVRFYYNTATVSNSTFTGNIADSADQTRGGGGGSISLSGKTTFINSTFSGNSAHNGGGIAATYSTGLDNDMTLINCTLSGNSAVRHGGGILFGGDTLTINNSTLTDNTANIGGGAYVFDAESYFSDDPPEALAVTNSILSGNEAITNAEIFGHDPLNVFENNIVGNALLTNNAAFNIIVDPNNNITATSNGNNPSSLTDILSPLANNNGPTQTHSLPITCPAVDAGNNIICPTDDQRGGIRVDGLCDIGAFELDAEFVTEDETNFFVVPTKNGKTIIFSL